MADTTVLQLINDQFANDIGLQARASNQAFVSLMAGNNSIHSRCAQVLDKRVAEYDIEEARAYSAIDPVSQSYMLSKAAQDSGNVQVNSAILLEILRASQAK
jgi:hypothetical protein